MASCTSTSLPGASSKVYFRPALFWQQVQPWHIADAGLEFRMNFATQKNEARFPSGVEFEPGTDRIMALRQEACRLVPDSDARDDSVALEKRLCDAATWGQDDKVVELLQTCYVTRALAVPALVEAASMGNVDVVKVFINAEPRLAFDVHPKYGKNAFHAAAERGQEQVLSEIVRCASHRSEFMTSRSRHEACRDSIASRK